MTETAERVRPSLTDARVARAIDLIWREADLLDRKAYVEWESLYDPAGRYIIPIDPTSTDFDNTLNMVHDDARMRSMRVVRMTEGYAIAAVDAARTVRTVSRFVVSELTDDSVSLRAAQVLVAFKRGQHHLWAGDVDFTVRLSTDSPQEDKILLKVVRLIDSEGVVPAAGFLL